MTLIINAKLGERSFAIIIKILINGIGCMEKVKGAHVGTRKKWLEKLRKDLDENDELNDEGIHECKKVMKAEIAAPDRQSEED